MVISHYFSQMCEIVCEKSNENFTCTSHAFHIISSSSAFPVPVNDLEQKTMVTMVSMCVKQRMWQDGKCH